MIRIRRKRKRLKTEEDRARAAAKAREKQRRKMVRTKFGQAPLRHARKGIYACFYGTVVLILLFLMILISYVTKGGSRDSDRPGGAGDCGAVGGRSGPWNPGG